MKNIFTIAMFLTVSSVLTAQVGPIIAKTGACQGYDIRVNGISYNSGNGIPIIPKCWDTNFNGIGDPSEDTNQDGVFNVLDCAGGPLCWDLNGNEFRDTGEDVNGDGVVNIHDCTTCWDTNFNDIEDADEDRNGDGVWDTFDCPDWEGNLGPTCWDTNENGVGDPAEDVNADGVFNVHDCPFCWDTNFNELQDPDEDANGDGLWNTDDCFDWGAGLGTCVAEASADPMIMGGNALQLTKNQSGQNILNGIDIVNIIKWLVIGFPGPLEAITSDFDADGTVSTEDVILLQRHILGLQQLIGIPALYVVLEGHDFGVIDPFDQSLDFTASQNLTFTDTDIVNDTLSIFVFRSGDTDLSAAFGGDDLESRSISELNFENKYLKAGEAQKINFSLIDDEGIVGSLFRLKSDQVDFLSLEGIGAAKDMIYNNELNQLAVSYAAYASNDTLSFEVELVSSVDGYLNDMLNLDDTFHKEIINANYTEEALTLNPVVTNTFSVLEDEYIIYPNPVRDNINIEFRDADFRDITLMNAAGQVIKNISSKDQKMFIELDEALNSGLYLLKIDSNTSTAVSKVIIE